MLDGGMPVSKVTEVVDVTGGKKCTGGEGVDRSITPL